MSFQILYETPGILQLQRIPLISHNLTCHDISCNTYILAMYHIRYATIWNPLKLYLETLLLFRGPVNSEISSRRSLLTLWPQALGKHAISEFWLWRSYTTSAQSGPDVRTLSGWPGPFRVTVYVPRLVMESDSLNGQYNVSWTSWQAFKVFRHGYMKSKLMIQVCRRLLLWPF